MAEFGGATDPEADNAWDLFEAHMGAIEDKAEAEIEAAEYAQMGELERDPSDLPEPPPPGDWKNTRRLLR